MLFKNILINSVSVLVLLFANLLASSFLSHGPKSLTPWVHLLKRQNEPIPICTSAQIAASGQTSRLNCTFVFYLVVCFVKLLNKWYSHFLNLVHHTLVTEIAPFPSTEEVSGVQSRESFRVKPLTSAERDPMRKHVNNHLLLRILAHTCWFNSRTRTNSVGVTTSV